MELSGEGPGWLIGPGDDSADLHHGPQVAIDRKEMLVGLGDSRTAPGLDTRLRDRAIYGQSFVNRTRSLWLVCSTLGSAGYCLSLSAFPRGREPWFDFFFFLNDPPPPEFSPLPLPDPLPI